MGYTVESCDAFDLSWDNKGEPFTWHRTAYRLQTCTEDAYMSNKRARYHNNPVAAAVAQPLPSGPKIPALVEELRAASTKVDDEVANKRARILDNALKEMSPDMQARFEFYMRSHFDSKVVKRMLQREIDCTVKDFATGGHAGEGVPIFTSTAYSNVRVPGVAPNVTDDMAIVVCGLAKLYVGELVDTAKDVMMERLTSAADEDADNNLPLVSAPEEGGGMGTGQSAFNMISSLGAQVTNDVLQLTKADIEEAARRVGDKGMHARDVGPIMSLFSDAPSTSRFSSVASILGQDRDYTAEWSNLIGSASGADGNEDEDEDRYEGGNMNTEGHNDGVSYLREEQGEILPAEKVFSNHDEEELTEMVQAYNQNVLEREVDHLKFQEWQEEQEKARALAEKQALAALQAKKDAQAAALAAKKGAK